MVSAQEDSIVELWAVRRDGLRKRVMRTNVSVTAPGGGASEGALASVPNIDERHVIPASGPMLRPDDKIEVVVTTAGADGIDVSDSVWNIPVTEYDVHGAVIGIKHLAQSDFANPAAADYTAVAAIPVVVAGYSVIEAGLRIGGSHIFLDIQDDA